MGKGIRRRWRVPFPYLCTLLLLIQLAPSLNITLQNQKQLPYHTITTTTTIFLLLLILLLLLIFSVLKLIRGRKKKWSVTAVPWAGPLLHRHGLWSLLWHPQTAPFILCHNHKFNRVKRLLPLFHSFPSPLAFQTPTSV